MVISIRTLAEQLSAPFRSPEVAATRITSDISDTANIGRPQVFWPDDGGPLLETSCPNCGSDTGKPLHLTVDFATLPGIRRRTTLLRCPDCTSLFFETQIPPDYAEEALLEQGRLPFHLQQGAGLSTITRPLARLRVPAGGAYMEVGCGFGFGLDYARHAKGWIASGIDPAQISALGRDLLGLSIESRYLGEAEPHLTGTYDVVMSSETLEHVTSPANFVHVLRDMLRPGGILVLGTPDGADLRRETSPDDLMRLLCPGEHLIFQTRESLRELVVAAGFRHVIIEKNGNTLVAFASDQPLDLETNNLALRAEYRAWLEHRAIAFPPEHDLFLGFAGRAFQEAVNDAAFEQARRVRNELERACHSRFHLPLDALGAQATRDRGISLRQLAQRMPLNLGGLLYADAILRLASGEKRASLGTRFLQSEAAADLLRNALGDLAMADGMTEDIAWTSRAEELLCAAAAGTRNVVARLSALPPAPDPRNGVTRRLEITQRMLVELVNASHYVLAAALSEANHFNSSSWADPNSETPRSVSERDALFCLAVVDSMRNEPALVQRSRNRFRRVRQLRGTLEAPDVPVDLVQAALAGEIAALERLGDRAAAADLRAVAARQSNG